MLKDSSLAFICSLCLMSCPLLIADISKSNNPPSPSESQGIMDESKRDISQAVLVACKDAGAGGHEGMPDVCRCRSGQLLCVFYAGYAHGSKPGIELPQGGRICFMFSSDEGKSWSKPNILCDTPADDRGPSVFQLDNGRLICTFFTSYPETIWRGTYACYSDDGGQTWSQPKKMVEGYYADSPSKKLTTGRWIMPLYRQDKTAGTQGAVMFSDDQCQTWSKPVNIPTGGVILPAETDVLELTDGTMYAIQRGVDVARWSVSHDGGLHWEVSKPLDFAVIAPYLIRVKNGIVVMAYGQRIKGVRWGTALRYSMDDCNTWSAPEVVDDVLGSHPSMVNLRDGSVLVMYYDERSDKQPAERSDIRARRFTASNQGIKWLSMD
ncbi:MAG: glycoside hydrolase [Planctomycetaceae bacterium]|nr:glycoside hydrolase [Planctomycetaceae bacterium]